MGVTQVDLGYRLKPNRRWRFVFVIVLNGPLWTVLPEGNKQLQGDVDKNSSVANRRDIAERFGPLS